MPPTAPKAATSQIRNSAIVVIPARGGDAEGDDENAETPTHDHP